MHQQVSAHAGNTFPLREVVVWSHSFDFFLSPTEDLWDCLEQASGKPIAAVMGSWTKQMGFPIIAVDQEQVSCLILLFDSGHALIFVD